MSLDEMRMEIDAIDASILETLAERVKVVLAVGEYKRARHLPILDIRRRNEALAHRIALGRTMGLSEAFVRDLYMLIHDYSVELEDER
jgi:chorismate mutase